MIVAFSVSPSDGDADGGVSEAVARAVKVVRDSGLPHSTKGVPATFVESVHMYGGLTC